LWEGNVDYHGQFYNVVAKLSSQARVPVLISTLSPNAFKAAGELSDGALTWLCPVPYLLQTALPALQEGARKTQRPAPPLVAHILVAVSTDRQVVLSATRQQTGNYGKLPFYATMFAESGHPVAHDGTMPDDLVESLVVSGTNETIAARFNELLSSGLDELLVMLIPVKNPTQEQNQLAQIIGQLGS
jgi:alkanesulfonate monooxygenase SsuD/methylene tetrahydromethanopterin reductase-like flavin-dependent oxidoreductase (luciferase family)